MFGQEFPVGRQDHVGRLALHVLLHQRYGHTGQVAAEGLEPFEGRAFQRREETGHALHVQHMRELVGYSVRRPCAKCLIGDLHECGFVLRALHHAIEFSLLTPLGRRLQGGGPRLQQAGQIHGLLDLEWDLTIRIRLKLAQHSFQSLFQRGLISKSHGAAFQLNNADEPTQPRAIICRAHSRAKETSPDPAAIRRESCVMRKENNPGW